MNFTLSNIIEVTDNLSTHVYCQKLLLENTLQVSCKTAYFALIKSSEVTVLLTMQSAYF